MTKETLTIDGKQYNRIIEGKINSKFIKYRIYDKIADEINKVEPADFNLRKFNSLNKKLVSFVQREVQREKKMGTMSVLKQAWKRSDFDDKVFGRSGIIDDWYKKSEKDFPEFMKKYTTYSDNPKRGWKKYNAGALTYGISKPLYKICDSLLDGINSLVPEDLKDSRNKMKNHILQENYERFFGKREFGDPLPTFEDVMEKHQVNKLEEGWWENMSDAAQKAYIKKHGEAPGSAGGDDNGEDDYDMGGDDRVPNQDFRSDPTDDDYSVYDDPELARIPDEDEYPDEDPINTKKGELEDEMEDIANELDNVTDPEERKELEAEYDKKDQELYDINKKQYGDDSGYEMSPADDEESSGRTGNELSRETLMINGKQYNRISEGVEQKPKPKYEFSEFYERFKK
jgi:hypothetical protein